MQFYYLKLPHNHDAKIMQIKSMVYKIIGGANYANKYGISGNRDCILQRYLFLLNFCEIIKIFDNYFKYQETKQTFCLSTITKSYKTTFIKASFIHRVIKNQQHIFTYKGKQIFYFNYLQLRVLITQLEFILPCLCKIKYLFAEKS